jgi:hypothetical protein
MQVYSVLMQETLEKITFVEEKFSFKALIFQGFWLLYHRIWLPAFIVLLLELSIIMLLKANYINNTLGAAALLIIAIIVAIFAKTWYIEKLKKNNYQLYSVVAANNLDEAKLRFYQLIKDQENV